MIYFIADFTKIIALSKDGILEWSLTEPGERWENATAISPVGDVIYLGGSSLVAIDLKQHILKWKTAFGSNSPLVDTQGNIYVLSTFSSDSTRLQSLDKNGNIRWSYNFKDIASTLTMDKNGNIYFGDVNVYSVDYSGKLNWKINSVNFYQPIISDDGNHIFVINSNSQSVTARELDQTGAIRWEATHQVQNYVSGFGAMVGYNTLLVPGWGNTPIVIFK